MQDSRLSAILTMYARALRSLLREMIAPAE